jgi:hypothetical protein
MGDPDGQGSSAVSLPAILALLGVAVAAGVVAWLLIRSRNGWPALPEWTWNDIRKNVALVSTILGAAVLTVMAWGLLDDLVMMAKGLIGDLLRHTGPQPPPGEVGTALEVIIGAVAWGLKLLLAGVIVVLLSLGFVITPRRFDFHGPGGIGGGFGGGDGEVPPPVKAAREVAEAADKKADEIAAKAPAPKADDNAGLPEALR